MPKKEKNKKEEKKGNPINYAVQQGIESIIGEHPKFANFQEYLLKHIDQKKIQEKFYNLYKEASNKGMNEKDAKKHIYKELTNYVASGDVIDDKGKEVILKEGLEEKTGFFHKIFHRTKFDGEKYLNNTMEAFHDLYALFKSGDYAKRMPELTQSVATLHDLNFLDPAVDVLKSYGLIDSKKHKFLKENIYKRVGEESEKVIGGIEKYIVPEKIAASIIGFIGVMLIVFNLNITGAAIGNSSNITIGITGVFFIFFALLLFFRPLKRSFKN
jgi:hypothetical protein